MSTVHCTIDFVDCLQLSITLLILSTFFGFGRSLRSVVLQLTSNIQLILVHSCYPTYVNVIQDMLILVNSFYPTYMLTVCRLRALVSQQREGIYCSQKCAWTEGATFIFYLLSFIFYLLSFIFYLLSFLLPPVVPSSSRYIWCGIRVWGFYFWISDKVASSNKIDQFWHNSGNGMWNSKIW